MPVESHSPSEAQDLRDENTVLRGDLLAARDVAKGAEAAAGALRGQVAQLHVELARARQDQDHFQRAVSSRAQSAASRLSRSLRTRFF